MQRHSGTGPLPVALTDALASGARLGAVVIEAGSERVAIDPDGRYPLASVRKVITLGGYALAVASGVCDPAEWVAVRDIDRWHWPGTDGGAHERARSCWAEAGGLRGPASEEIVPLAAAARAVIQFSDNAAADYLLHRLGAEPAAAFVEQMGLTTQDPIVLQRGEFRAWHRFPDEWVAMSPAARTKAAWEIAATEPSPLDSMAVDEATQRRCAAAGCSGSPRDWARLMAKLADGTGLPSAAGRTVREALERPARRGDDGVFGAKAGNLAGVLTFAGYVRARSQGAPVVAVAMFLANLDAGPLDRLRQLIPGSPSQLLELAEALTCTLSGGLGRLPTS